MKKLTTLLTLLLVVSENLYAQYSTDWIRPADSYQKTGKMMACDKNDNVVVTGYWIANNIYTRKYDKFGNLQWENISSSGVSLKYEMSYWINCDSSNNVIVTGCRYSFGQFNYPDALVILKYDPAGNLLWKNTIPMSFFVNSTYSFNMRSEVDNNGNIYVGTVAVTPAGFVLLKMDTDGNILFTNNDNSLPVGLFRSMRLVGNQVVMCGGTPVTNNANAICWNISGTVVWNTILSGNSGIDIEMDESGNTYLLSSLNNQVSPSSGEDFKIYKINSSGSQVWVNNYDFGGFEFPVRFTYVAGKVSVIGYGNISGSYFDWITFQTDNGGTKLWDARYNETTVNDEQSYFITAKANGDVFVTGRGGPNFNLLGSNYLRMITVKYDNNGLRKWVDSVNVYSGRGIACSIASDGSLYVLSDAYTTAFHFLDHTGGILPPVPTGLMVSNVNNNSATFSWTPVPGAYLYHLRYKETSASAWTVVSIGGPPLVITGLNALTSYDYSCEAISESGPSGYSATQTFITGGALPVTGLELRAIRSGTNVNLIWTTQSEQNSAYFNVERSYDGIVFSTIGQVQAAGFSTIMRNYQFTDVNAPKSMIFYRLKLVDADAGYKFSQVRVVARSDGNNQNFLLYPNPATSSISIILNEAAKEDMHLKIINPMGQIVKRSLIVKGSQVLKPDISTLPKGIYMITLTGKEAMQSMKLLIK